MFSVHEGCRASAVGRVRIAMRNPVLGQRVGHLARHTDRDGNAVPVEWTKVSFGGPLDEMYDLKLKPTSDTRCLVMDLSLSNHYSDDYNKLIF